MYFYKRTYHIQIPISIVKCGFLSNREEEVKLQTDEYQDKLAWGIYTGIVDYFNEIKYFLAIY